MMIPDDKISEIKNAADILEIISESVILKKAGRNHIGLCPFHNEKTPSFSVNPEKQIYKCFGCGEGGNVFTFLMKKDGYSFPESVRFLGKRYGIDIPDKALTPEQRQNINKRESIFKVNRQGLNFFRDQLKNGPGSKNAMEYLLRRGFTEETIERFELGYAPGGWDQLIQYMGKRGVPLPWVEKAGLIIQKETNRYYDRFRDRIIFPIFDLRNEVLGFGGRIIKNDPKQPKYLNSPETFVYHKKRSLYGLHAARPSAREQRSVFIVEGYFDFIALFQHGIKNTVATLGTALSTDHAKIIKGFAGTIYLVFDSDQAGIKAAERGIDIFGSVGIDTKIIVLPTGYDPDSFVFEKGEAAFLSLKASALSSISFLIHMAVKRHGLSVEGKLQIVNEMLPPLSKISDTVQKALYVKELAEQVSIEETAILNKISEFRNHAAQQYHVTPQERPGALPHAENAKKALYHSVYNDRFKIEKQIVTMLLQFPEIVSYFYEKKIIQYFENKILGDICRLIIENKEQNENTASHIINKAEDDDMRRLIAHLAVSEEEWVYEGCRKLIDQFAFSKNRKNNNLDYEIRQAEEAQDFEKLKALLAKKNLQLALLKKEQYMSR